MDEAIRVKLELSEYICHFHSSIQFSMLMEDKQIPEQMWGEIGSADPAAIKVYLYFNKGKHSLGQCGKVLALSAVAFLPLEKPTGKLIWSSMKPIYTDHLQFCDLAVRALVNMFSILFHFTFQTLLFSLLSIQL